MIGFPCAKINLGLNIVGKRQDGYHNLETVFYPIKLCDKIEINECSSNIGESCQLNLNGIKIEGNVSDNLVVKAYNKVKKLYPQIPPVTITLIKNIPSQAGLGGGSSDCAYTIILLNEMFNLGMSISDMQTLAVTLGADCAFFIKSTPAFATGIGECLEPINVDLSKYVIGVVKPELKISTKEAFAQITPMKPTKCCKDIVAQPIETWKYELVNDFELNIAQRYKEISEIKQAFYDLGAVYAAMSGSGSAVFGLFHCKPDNFEIIFNKYFSVII